jgi:hypothetical protein
MCSRCWRIFSNRLAAWDRLFLDFSGRLPEARAEEQRRAAELELEELELAELGLEELEELLVLALAPPARPLAPPRDLALPLLAARLRPVALPPRLAPPLVWDFAALTSARTSWSFRIEWAPVRPIFLAKAHRSFTVWLFRSAALINGTTFSQQITWRKETVVMAISTALPSLAQ